MPTDPAQALAHAILRQAVSDWRDLLRRERDPNAPPADGSYSHEEIEEFLLGDWCRTLLIECGIGTTGERILRQLESEA